MVCPIGLEGNEVNRSEGDNLGQITLTLGVNVRLGVMTHP